MKSPSTRMFLAPAAAAFSLCFATVVTAAIPNLSLQQLREGSSLIVEGTITDVKVENLALDFGGQTFLNERFLITMRVERVQKGEAEQTITFETWRPKTRPDGFTGPQGQGFIPAKGDKVRAYCRTADGRTHLLEPNGILKIGGGKNDKGKPQQSQ